MVAVAGVTARTIQTTFGGRCRNVARWVLAGMPCGLNARLHARRDRRRVDVKHKRGHGMRRRNNVVAAREAGQQDQCDEAKNFHHVVTFSEEAAYAQACEIAAPYDTRQCSRAIGRETMRPKLRIRASSNRRARPRLRSCGIFLKNTKKTCNRKSARRCVPVLRPRRPHCPTQKQCRMTSRYHP